MENISPLRFPPSLLLNSLLLILIFPHPLPGDQELILPSLLDVSVLSENTEIEPGTSMEEIWSLNGRGILALGVRKKPGFLADLGMEAVTEFGGRAHFLPYLRAGFRGERLEFLLGRISPLTLGEPWFYYLSGFRSELWGVKGQLLFPWVFGGVSLDRETAIQYGTPERFRVHGVSGIGGFLPFQLRYEWVLDHGGGFDTPRYASLRDGAPTFQQFVGVVHLRFTPLDPFYLQMSGGKSWGALWYTPTEGRIFASEVGWEGKGEKISLLLQATGFFRDHDFILHRGLPWLEGEGEGIERALWLRGNLRLLLEGFYLDAEIGELIRFTPKRSYWNFIFLMVGYRYDPFPF
jgi:hypothetical protein